MHWNMFPMFLSLNKKHIRWENVGNISVVSRQYNLNNGSRKDIRKVIETLNNGEKGNILVYSQQLVAPIWHWGLVVAVGGCLWLLALTGGGYSLLMAFSCHCWSCPYWWWPLIIGGISPSPGTVGPVVVVVSLLTSPVLAGCFPTFCRNPPGLGWCFPHFSWWSSHHHFPLLSMQKQYKISKIKQQKNERENIHMGYCCEYTNIFPFSCIFNFSDIFSTTIIQIMLSRNYGYIPTFFH